MKKYASHALAISILLFTSHSKAGQLQLTPFGVASGFSLSTVVQLRPDFPGDVSNLQPYGLTTIGTDRVLVNDYLSGIRYVFRDVDGQTAANALFSYSTTPTPAGYATVNGTAYGGDGSNVFVRFNADGSINSTIVPGAIPRLGMAAAPNGHLFATTLSQGLIDINPVTNTYRVLNASIPASSDGVSFSLDGRTIFVASDELNDIIGYDSTTGAVVFNSGNIGHFPDGTAVIQSNNALNGMIVINNNDGSVGLLDPTHVALGEMLVATGGSRGDYVSPDVNNGSLLLDFSESVLRLSCGNDCRIGSASPGPGPGPAPVPEPATWMLLLAGTGMAMGRIGRKGVDRSASTPVLA